MGYSRLWVAEEQRVKLTDSSADLQLHQINAFLDPDPAFYVSADLDPDSAFQFNADPDASPHQRVMRVRVHGPPRLHFQPRKLLNFDVNEGPDPNPAFHSNADPDPNPTANNNADPDSLSDGTFLKLY